MSNVEVVLSHIKIFVGVCVLRLRLFAYQISVPGADQRDGT
jgi:hypothetical protein